MVNSKDHLFLKCLVHHSANYPQKQTARVNLEIVPLLKPTSYTMDIVCTSSRLSAAAGPLHLLNVLIFPMWLLFVDS